MNRPIPYLLPVLLVAATNTATAEIGGSGKAGNRWYTTEQVTQGGILFRANCPECHGQQAESTPHWRKPGEDGSYPPPPLNGTAHTWHHPLPLLRRTIRDGGVNIGGKMPPFKEKLSDQEIDMVIAWFQSLWSDEIYATWSGMGKPMISQPEFLRKLIQDIQ